MRSLPSFVLSLFLLSIASTQCLAAELFVSPSGDDAQPGTKEKPLRTLAAAQTAVRKLKTDQAVTVTIRGGRYELAKPLIFTPEDNGTKNHPILWQAAAGEEVVLSGGQTLQLTWQAYRNGIFSAALPEGVTVDQLFLNGERLTLARYPNFDPHVSIFNGYAADAIDPQRIAHWSDPTTGIFHAMHPGKWGGFSYWIKGKKGDGTLELEGGWQGNRPGDPHKQFRFIENIFEELDAPGEWFADKKTRTLYVYPPQGVDLSTAVVQAVSLRSLIELRGSLATPVEWITFRGLTFTQTARTFMETREPLLRTDWTIYRGGALLLDGTEDCQVDDCDFDQVGGNAIFVNNYNRRVTVQNCRIERSGAGGVTFVGDPAAVRSPLFRYEERQPLAEIDLTPGPKTENYPADCLVEDCLITQVGRFEKQSTGVGIDMAARITVRHCSIYDVPRAGINIGDGCWGGHLVEFCDVFDTVLETGDHGAFNSWGRDRFWLSNAKEVNARVAAHPELPLLDVVEPIVLRNNRWRCDHGWDIDLDDGSSNYHIYNNLCLSGGIKNREGYRRTVENNIAVGNGFHPHVWYANSHDRFERNIVFRKHAPIGMPAAWGDSIDRNLLHSEAAKSPEPAKVLQASSKQDADSISANALFVDPAHGDFTVQSDSPALKLGFQNFPMNQFGVRTAKLKALARTPSFSSGKEEKSKRDQRRSKWQDLTVRNVIGLGDQSAFGLPSEAGMIVVAAPANSALAKAGVQVGDVIIECDGKEIAEIAKLPKSITSMKTITIWRNQQAVVLQLAGA
ncbi:right-handed parallel beta-helix repeat-containing protein [Blastopirellula sp. JC732]|uniref:Right-handed parallel beta-helix repeat-containing protein n=1 Tax=Blastopirellula sediminis TaxID=2894196 RepID=A0A9X1MJC2_9BACT|nr:right-handed parallel beta-helix repeat-containing protein [Blastopirellula sediminis]MCC9607827.1 right-handed parallel beta-helix repeat-containing protein [Blastopirellula sediminis]MCC9627380.1 right-handed parallel beta-helix repeat-containing protein [Blastopirellula sediminis]